MPDFLLKRENFEEESTKKTFYIYIVYLFLLTNLSFVSLALLQSCLDGLIKHSIENSVGMFLIAD